MKHTPIYILAALGGLWLLGGCSSGGSESATPSAREAWRATLPDSLKHYEQLQAAAQSRADSLYAIVSAGAESLEVIDDEILVEKYRVAPGWKGYDTTASTGLLLRLLESNDVELVASLKGAPFTSIEVSTAAGESAATEAVAQDGELNYRIGGLSRVAFNGESAERITTFVLAHLSEPLTLTFRPCGSRITLSEKQKSMFATLGTLWQEQQKLNEALTESQKAYNKAQVFAAEVAKDRAASNNKEK